jgi:hypothetical protein
MELTELIKLPYTYNVQNSLELAQNIAKINTNMAHKITTYDIKDLYVNFPIEEVIRIIFYNRYVDDIIIIMMAGKQKQVESKQS